MDILTEYVSGKQTRSAVEEWLAGVDWDDPDLIQDSKDVFSLLELLKTEVSEGLRDEGELVKEARDFIATANQPTLDGIGDQSQKELS